MLNLKYTILNADAVEPKYANEGDAGMDLTATSIEVDPTTGIVTYGTGIAMSIPKGNVGLLFPRSSVYKKDISMANSVGVIDSGYRGEIKIKFRITDYKDYKIYNVGDRIGQIVILPTPSVNVEKVDSLEESVRGEGGFGSTGE